MAREFQTVGAVQRKARSAKRVLVVGLYSNGTSELQLTDGLLTDQLTKRSRNRS